MLRHLNSQICFLLTEKKKNSSRPLIFWTGQKKIWNVRFLLTLGALDDVGPSQFVWVHPTDTGVCSLLNYFFSYQFKIHEIIESKEKSWRRFARNARRLSCLGLRVTVDSFRVHFPYVRHNKLVLLFFQIFIQDKYHIFPPLKTILNFISVEYFQGDDLFYSNMSIDPTQ